MSITHKLSRSWSRSGADPLTYEKEVTADSESNYSGSLADGTSDEAVNLAIDVSELKCLFIASDQDITIETNQPGGGSGAADDTLAVKANQAVAWSENDVHSCPLTADVTILYITNASGSTANVEIRVLQDATP